MLAAIVGLSTPALAQEQPSPDTALRNSGTGRIVYDQSYFAEYDIRDAEDMLRLIPGVGAILADLGSNSQERGFGSGGDQVLLNGRRFPGKSNEITKTLARLRADNVQRVELIRGAVDDIDVQSAGLVVNIVLKDGTSLGGGGTFELNMRGNDEGALAPDGLVSYSGSTGALGYSVGVERNLWSPDSLGPARWTNRRRDDRYYYPDGTLREIHPEFWSREHDKWIFTGNLTYDFSDGGRVQFNGLYQTFKVFENSITPFIRFDETGSETYRATDERRRWVGPNRTTELSGEYTRALGRGDLTILAIANWQSELADDYRSRSDLDGDYDLSANSKDARQTEYIGRAEYGFPLTGKLSANVGGELSYNRLKQAFAVSFDLDSDGTLEPVDLPTADSLVSEWRGEAFVEFKYTPTPAVSVNGSITYETSDLRSNSVFNPGRSLSYFKPRIDARYSVSERGQLRLLIERQISQLNFDNFVPSYNLLDDRIEAGNPGLLPERTWNFELGFEQRLKQDAGVLELKLFYMDIAGPIDFVPLPQGDFIVSAYGNLGKGWEYGAEGTASVRLIPLGLRDAVLSLRGLLQNSEVTDPFSGVPRRLRNDSKYQFDVGLRHDVRALGLSYGFDYRNLGGHMIQSELFSRDDFQLGPMLTAFAEIRLNSGLSLRGEARNMLGDRGYRKRQIFETGQVDGVISRLDDSTEIRDLRYAVTLKGSF